MNKRERVKQDSENKMYVFFNEKHEVLFNVLLENSTYFGTDQQRRFSQNPIHEEVDGERILRNMYVHGGDHHLYLNIVPNFFKPCGLLSFSYLTKY